MKVHLINLDRSADRLAHMQAVFAGAGVSFERIAAIDGATLSAEELEPFRPGTANPNEWRAGEVGCFLSHRKAWRRVATSDDRFAAIFEDDIHLSADLGALLASSDWIPADADIVRLEAFSPMRLVAGRAIPGLAGRKIHRALSGTAGAAGYILAKQAAASLCKTERAHYAAADAFLFKPKNSPVARRLRRYQVVPAVCVQSGVLPGTEVDIQSLIKPRYRRGRGYREHCHPLLSLWPLRRRAVPFRA